MSITTFFSQLNHKLDFVNLVSGAVLGTLLTYLVPFLTRRVRLHRKRRLIRLQQAASGRNLYEWLISYYERNGHLEDLYTCSLGNLTDKVPILTKRNWQHVSPIQLSGESLVRHDDGVERKFPVDERLLAKRAFMGQKLFNDPSLYLDALEEEPNSIILRVKSCKYFELATSLIRLEEETYDAVRRRRRSSLLPIRNNHFSSVDQAARCSLKPFSVGCAGLMALEVEGTYEFIIQTRSSATITAGNLLAGIPQFGLMPVPQHDENLGILPYNFVKEYCEELYNREDLVQLMQSRHLPASWLGSFPEAGELLGMIHNGTCRLYSLGFGIDALSGTGTIAMLALIKNAEFAKSLRSKFAANWEIAQRQAGVKSIEPLRFVNWHSVEFEDWLRSGTLYYGSAFTIALAVKFLSTLEVGKGTDKK